jgi:hypothetical protein
MKTDDLILYQKERHKLMMRIIEIIEYSNLYDLRTLNGILVENGFAKDQTEVRRALEEE